MDAILPTTYNLIYTFLTKHDHIKAAQALKKAAKHVVVLKDGLLSDGPSLDQIVQEWKEFKAHASASPSSQSSSDPSSEESSSSSDSEPAKLKTVSRSKSDSDSDSDSGEETEQPRLPRRAKSKVSTPSHTSAQSSDSDSGSESDDESSDAECDKVQKPDAKKFKTEYESSRTVTSGGDSSSESGSDDDDDDASEGVPEPILNIIKVLAKGNDDTSEESSSDSSSEEEAKRAPAFSSTLKQAPVRQTNKAKAKEDVDEERPIKKRKSSEDGEPLPIVKQPIPMGGKNSNAPFRRVDLSKVSSNIVVDNRYENKASPANDYGHRAYKDLISTRGAGFRKEKNKKKRGSYKGGEITLESHSYKFT
ncbi:hypothetical protein APHAL10511_000988 [Amanita phalloides]|nr:hypothetical protein APHAL10511_000988 [Amanita phalloides]